MTAHDGGNGLDAKEYARVRATVCVSEWTGGDLAAWFAMCALYVITHVPIAAIRAHTDADAVLVAVMYPLYLLVVAYMSKDLFAKYATRDNRFYTRVHFWMYLPFWVHSAIVVVRGAYFDVILFFFITLWFAALIDSFHDAQKEAKWQAHLAAHANRACYFHADCLCACDACTAPADGPRHAGDEKHGVDVRAYLAGADLGAPDPWIACCFGAATAAMMFASLVPYILYMVHPSGNAIIFWMHLAFVCFSQLLTSMLISFSVLARAECMRHPLVYGPFVLCAFVWNTAMVGVAYWIATEAPETRWLAPVVHVLGFVVLCAAALAGFYGDQKKREAAHIRAHVRPECTMHPQCLCTCDRCGPAPAPARRKSARLQANSP